ncbi:MAG: isoamylase [Actinomycetota bacterium]|nr:isoamylase [Actinomycetota bacterium]
MTDVPRSNLQEQTVASRPRQPRIPVTASRTRLVPVASRATCRPSLPVGPVPEVALVRRQTFGDEPTDRRAADHSVGQTAHMDTHRVFPYPLGVHICDGGVDVAVFAAHATAVELCLLDPDGRGAWTERRVPIERRSHGVWYGHVPGVGVGQHYGLRVHGPWEPERGHRHNPAKLLLDPCARAVTGFRLCPEVFGHVVDSQFLGDHHRRDTRDSLPFAPHGVVTDTQNPGPDDRPRIPWDETVLYEAHVRGLTRAMPGVPEALRGTYAGLATPAAVDHLLELGVTTVELMPIHAIGHEPALVRRGKANYWGYSTLSYFAPHPGYAAAQEPLLVVEEFRSMVRTLHAAGLEVVLDVVYNHTCEVGLDGPMLSWRGLDAASYYRLDHQGEHLDTTGCGNTLDARNPRVVQMILDSLRYWVQQLHVDGFRFDLAPTLARGQENFDPRHPVLVAAATDPVLCGVKLIAEPWDLGPHGWRTGQFPIPFAEWNDRFRDSVRDFWLTGVALALHDQPAGGVREIATRLAGSADLFGADRGPMASVNLVTAHDGFTAADLTAYDTKHNRANGEGNRDGTVHNLSWNHGVEGDTDNEPILSARRLSIRNLLGTLLLSTGVPMLVAGDELGRTQKGNNNAYCQDNDVSWVDWDLRPWQEDLLATVRYLIKLRREHRVLRQDRFFDGRILHSDGTKDLAWFDNEGVEMDLHRWHDPNRRILQMFLYPPAALRTDGASPLLLVLQGDARARDVVLPGRPWAEEYSLLWDSAEERPPGEDREPVSAGTIHLPGHCLRVYGVLGNAEQNTCPPQTAHR